MRRLPPDYRELVRWYRAAIWYEMPSIGHCPEAAAAMSLPRHASWDNIHAQHRTSGTDGITGPAAEYVNDSPYAIDEDGYYKWPLKAALATLGKRDPYLARFLRALPGHGWEPTDTALALAVPLYVPCADRYALYALSKLRVFYCTRPIAFPRRTA